MTKNEVQRNSKRFIGLPLASCKLEVVILLGLLGESKYDQACKTLAQSQAQSAHSGSGTRTFINKRWEVSLVWKIYK